MAEEIGVILKAVDQFSATMDQFNKKLDDMQKGMKNAGANGKTAFDGLKSGIMSLLPSLSALAIINWTKGAVEDAEKYNESLRHLQAAVESTGADFNKQKKSIEDWAESIQKATRFSDDQAVNSLETLVKKTGDLTTAQKLSQLAMDLTVKYGGNLEDRVNSLGLAYIGNQRGILSLQKEFKGMLQGAEDGTEIFKRLTAQVAGAAEKSDVLTDRVAKLTHEYDEQKKKIGQDLIPSAMGLATAFEYLTVIFDDIIGAGAIMYTTIETGVKGLVSFVGDSFTTILRVGTDAWNGIGAIAKKVLAGDLTGAFKASGDAFNKITTDTKNGINQLYHDLVVSGTSGSMAIKQLLLDMQKEWDDVGAKATGVLTNLGGIIALETTKEIDARKKCLEEQKKLYEKYANDFSTIWADQIIKNINGQQGFSDTIKNAFDDMVSYIEKKLIELAANAVFGWLISLVTGGASTVVGSAIAGATAGITGHANGGYINETGPALLHAGEYVIPAAQVNAQKQASITNNSMAPNITINGYNKDPNQLAEEIGLILQKTVRGMGQTGMVPA